MWVALVGDLDLWVILVSLGVFGVARWFNRLVLFPDFVIDLVAPLVFTVCC